MSKSVSAIVSAYYAEEYLQGRLENLAEQSIPPEIKVVCQEGSFEEVIARKFRLKNLYELTLVLTKDIPTIYSAWNQGIAVAKGAFITNANCDDRLRAPSLEIMANELDRHPKYAVVYGDQEIVTVLGGITVGNFNWLEGGFPELLHGCFVGPMPMWRKALHDKYGLFDASYRVAGDYEFWLRIASKGEKFLHLRAPVGVYLDRPESAEHRESVRTAWETSRIRSLYKKEYPNVS